MQWVASQDSRYHEWQTGTGETIKNRDFFGATYKREGGPRPPDAARLIRDDPWVFITSRPPGNVIQPHFHEVPQYQLFIEGSGRVGKHALEPLTVHYTDPYTPYGPIVAGDDGLAFMTIRAQTSNSGAFFLPKARPQMVRKAGRTVTVHADLEPDGIPAGQARLDQLIPLSEDGLEAKLVSLGAGALCRPPESGLSRDGCLVVASGALRHDGSEYRAHSCVFLRAGEPTPELVAAADGAQVLLLRFPPGVPHPD